MIKLKNDIKIIDDTLIINTLDTRNTENFVKIVNKYVEISITKCVKNPKKIAVYLKVKRELWVFVNNCYHLYNTSGKKELINVINYLITNK